MLVPGMDGKWVVVSGEWWAVELRLLPSLQGKAERRRSN